jgi:hypothetical protein
VTGTSFGICFDPDNLNDPHCHQIPFGADTAFGKGISPGNSSNSLFQSSSNTITWIDPDFAGQTRSWNNKFVSRMTSVRDPNNPNQRIHTIHQEIDFGLLENPTGIGVFQNYRQDFKMVFDINSVTDGAGGLIGHRSAYPGCVSADPNAACGSFTLSILDNLADDNCFTGAENAFPIISGGHFAVAAPAPPNLSGAVTMDSGFQIACTSETAANGCVGPILSPLIYRPEETFLPTPGVCP